MSSHLYCYYRKGLIYSLEESESIAMRGEQVWQTDEKASEKRPDVSQSDEMVTYFFAGEWQKSFAYLNTFGQQMLSNE